MKCESAEKETGSVSGASRGPAADKREASSGTSRLHLASQCPLEVMEGTFRRGKPSWFKLLRDVHWASATGKYSTSS